MKQVSFYPKGTKVYTVFLNKITEYVVEDVYIDIKQDKPVNYKLNGPFGNTHLGQDLVFDSIGNLKDHILKQFEELTPQKVEEQKTETVS